MGEQCSRGAVEVPTGTGACNCVMIPWAAMVLGGLRVEAWPPNVGEDSGHAPMGACNCSGAAQRQCSNITAGCPPRGHFSANGTGRCHNGCAIDVYAIGRDGMCPFWLHVYVVMVGALGSRGGYDRLALTTATTTTTTLHGRTLHGASPTAA